MPSIVCKKNSTPYFIVRTLTSIGRSDDNDLIVDDPDVALITRIYDWTAVAFYSFPNRAIHRRG